MTRINSLTLTAFRNYDITSIDGLDSQFIALISDNGAGKTNCLEAISLLSPGRGLRGASVGDIQSHASKNTPWAVSAKITDTDGDTMQLGVGRDPHHRDKKIIRKDGNTIKSQAELGETLRTVWLTPQMDGLFLQGTSERRRFFDRLVATFDPAHTGRMTRYEKAMRERLNILKTANDKGETPDASWLDGLENIMAETSVAIGAGRNHLVGQLQHLLNDTVIKPFPHAHLSLRGDVEMALEHQSALSVEDMVRDKLSHMRHADGATGRTNFGIQRTDMHVSYTNKNMSADQCSTGEQKALLTAIIIAHAHLVAKRFGAPPLLLFDEIAAHFDQQKRDSLYHILSNLGGQIWITGQDTSIINSLSNVKTLHIQNNKILT